MNAPFSIHPGSRRAFSLIELLVAVAVMVVILILLLQISGSTLLATRVSRQQLEASQQIRHALDSLALDLANRVTGHGLTLCAARDDDGNTRLAFLAGGRSPNRDGQAPSRFLSIRYELDGTDLIKRIAPVGWDDPKLMDAVLAPVQPETIRLASGILRFEMVAVLHDGTVVSLTQTGDWKTSSIGGQSIPAPFSGLVLDGDSAQRIRSLIIGIAAIDARSLELPGVSTAGAKLPSPPVGRTPLETWTGALLSGSLDPMPPAATAVLRFDQRSYLLQ